MKGAEPAPGAQPKGYLQLAGGAEPLLTSGGEAIAKIQVPFALSALYSTKAKDASSMDETHMRRQS